MKFGLMFFATGESTLIEDKYSLVIESAKFADKHGFSSVWLPERHFASLGCLYPNPAVLHAALARETEQIRLQAGSVVLPLHNPLRIAEDWAIVDNLSKGRVGISFAPGWNPDDFAFFPEKYSKRHQEMYSGIETVKKLWLGESIQVTNGVGKQIEVKVYPTPIQKNLPVWITAASNPQTFIKAGETGANLLTHMLDQSIEELAKNFALYRQALAKNGHSPEAGQITLMLHTFVGENLNLVREQARKPFCEYLKSNGNLLNQLAQSRGRQLDVTTLSQNEVDEFVNFLYERFYSTRALIGTPETCIELVIKLYKIGVNEITCFLDFGLDNSLIIKNLQNLNLLKEHYKNEFLLRESIEINELYQNKYYPGNTLNTQDNGSISSIIGIDTSEQNLEYLKKIKDCSFEEIAGVNLYQTLSEFGAEHGSTFQCVKRVYLRNEEALGEIQLFEEWSSQTNSDKFRPVLLHNCFLILGTIASKEIFARSRQSFILPIGMQGLEVYKSMSNKLWSYAIRKVNSNSENFIEGDVYVLNESGDLVAKSWGVKFQIVDLTLSENSEITNFSQPNSYEGVAQSSIDREDINKKSPVKNVVVAAPSEERWTILENYFCEQISKVIGLPINKVNTQQQLLNLGLDSLMAIELRNRIEYDLGIVVSVVKFLENPSIAQLVEYVLLSLNLASDFSESVLEINHYDYTATSLQSWSPLVAIQTDGNQTPFFCIHPISGNILCYTELARHLGSEQPFYGLQSPLIKGSEKPLARIEDMATYYINALQTVQPKGPYMIGGWSLGGIIAYEMAQQLSSQGHEIALLSLIDSYASALLNQIVLDKTKTGNGSHNTLAFAAPEINDITLINYFINNLFVYYNKDFLLSIHEQANFEVNEQLNKVLEQAKANNVLSLDVKPQQIHQMFHVFKINFLARYHYVPQPYLGRMTLFCAQEQFLEGMEDSTLGWSELILGGVETYKIPGDHYSIIREPHVQILAKHLQECLKGGFSTLNS